MKQVTKLEVELGKAVCCELVFPNTIEPCCYRATAAAAAVLVLRGMPAHLMLGFRFCSIRRTCLVPGTSSVRFGFPVFTPLAVSQRTKGLKILRRAIMREQYPSGEEEESLCLVIM